MHRFYADPENCMDNVVSLPEEDARHACTVLRMKSGQQAEIIMNGSRRCAEMVSVSPKNVRLKLLSALVVAVFLAIPYWKGKLTKGAKHA